MNTAYHTLAQLAPGNAARVKDLHLTGSIRRRLLDLGMIEGTYVECVGLSPAGDPAAYLIRGAVIALRQADCCGIEVM